MKYKKWAEEDFELLRCLSEAGYTAREIATELGCSENSVKHYKSKLGISTRNNSYTCDKRPAGPHAGGRPAAYTKEQLIEIMRQAPIHTYDYFNSKGSGLPAATTYRRYFGSWENALKAAGLQPNATTMKQNIPTKVYLLDFGEFYKVGITQQAIHKRFGGKYPEYEVVLVIETTLDEAKKIEAEWLQNVREYKYVPGSFPVGSRGHTECFKVD